MAAESKKPLNTGRRSDALLILAAVFTIVLATMVITGVRHEAPYRPTGREQYDVDEISGQIRRGKLSGHEAEYWEPAP